MSTLERRFYLIAMSLLVDHMPEMVRELRFVHERRWRFDFSYPKYRLAVECDGGQWSYKGGRHNTDADREKMNAAASQGWTVLRFSSTMLQNGSDVAQQVRQAIERAMREGVTPYEVSVVPAKRKAASRAGTRPSTLGGLPPRALSVIRRTRTGGKTKKPAN
jgi:very-short-patch-repair endonuclease